METLTEIELPSETTADLSPLSYEAGADVLGAYIPSNKAVVVKVRDIPELVASQGGKAGAMFMALAPATIEGKVYDDMAREFKKGLSEKGVKADVQVVDMVLGAPIGTHVGWKYAALGLGGVGLFGLFVHLITRGRR